MTSELLLVQGFDLDRYLRLRPHVTALPIRTAVNVNTASAELLLAISPRAEAGSVEAFLAERISSPLEDLASVRAHPLFDNEAVELDGLGVGSDWFRLDGRVSLRRVRLRQHALLYRADDEVRVVRRWTGLL